MSAELVALLSQRELQVVRMACKGYSYKETAGRLEISTSSVGNYKARAKQKLRVRSDFELCEIIKDIGLME